MNLETKSPAGQLGGLRGKRGQCLQPDFIKNQGSNQSPIITYQRRYYKFTAPPWPGLMSCLIEALRADEPKLISLVLEQIAGEAKQR